MSNYGPWIKPEERQSVFGAYAQEYDQFRPRYPAQLFQELVARATDSLGRAPNTALDLACGTGRGAEMLSDAVDHVYAIDPDEGMLQTLQSSLRHKANITAQKGAGEATGLPDNSVDIGCCLQAWHWLDGPRAMAELYRVLRPGGVFVVAWNDRTGVIAEEMEALIQTYNPKYVRNDPASRPTEALKSLPDTLPLVETKHYLHSLHLPNTAAAVKLMSTFSQIRNGMDDATRAAFTAQCAQVVERLAGGPDKPLDIELTCQSHFLVKKK